MKRLCLLFTVFGLFVFKLNAQQTNKKPNIIFILTDDLGYGDIGVFFQNERKDRADRSEPWTATPNIDSLAYSGAMLTQNYCAAPVCAPSRASILLGMSQGHANVRDNQFDKALADNYTLASVLDSLGYTTAAIGKWGLQGDSNNVEVWPAHPLNRGFDYFFGYMRHRDGHEHYPKEGLYRGVKEVWDNRVNITDKLDKCYTADLWTARTKKWIVDFEKENKDKPFFIYLAYETPHAVLELPTQAYPEGKGLHGGLQWLDEAGHMINTASGKIDSYYHPDYADATYDDDKERSTPEVAWPDINKRYATDIRRIDDGIGDIIQLLKDLNIYDNTLVVFTSDNGPSIESYLPEKITPEFFNSFGPFDGIKRDCWEAGIRMPTIASWPAKIPAGSKIDLPSTSYDWMATFTDAAGLPAPESCDGVSLLPSLTGNGIQQKGLVYVEYFQNESTPGFPEFAPAHRKRKRGQMQVIRFGDTVGVRYNIKSADDDFEIYDVVHDPQEINNLADNASVKTLQQKMKDKVLQVRMADTAAARPYDSTYIPAINSMNTSAGLRWKFYEGSFAWVPDVSSLKAIDSGTVKTFDPSLIKKNKTGILCIEGFIKLPADAVYNFYLNADAPAFVRLHGAQLIDADYGYKKNTVKTSGVKLKAGLHPVRLYYRYSPAAHHILKFQWQTGHNPRKDVTAGTMNY